MRKWLSTLVMLGAVAQAAPPAVDFSVLPPSADVRPRQPDGKDHPVRARLVSDHSVVTAGQTVRIGVHLEQQPSWHTYWKSPGEIGLPTQIDWSLPQGFVASDYAFPVPTHYFVPNVGHSYGYDDQVMLFSEVVVPNDAAPGPITVGASVNWLVCKTLCIPGAAELSLPLTVGAQAQTTGFGPLFDYYANQQPHPSERLGIEGALSSDKLAPNKPFRAVFRVVATDAVPLILPPKGEAWPLFTPLVGSDWMLLDTKLSQAEDGAVLVVLEGETFDQDTDNKAPRIGGLFQIEREGKQVATEWTMPLPWAAAGAATTPSTSPLWGLVPKATEGAANSTTPSPAAPSAFGAAAPVTPVAPATSGLSLIPALLGALFGGLILNIMPCVLPVLALKLYGLVEQVDIAPADQRKAGLAYTAGILASFWTLAAVVVAVRSLLGVDVAWGFQFQYPPYVAALAVVVFAFGLSLFGVFEIPALGVETASNASAKEGVAGYFMTGVFATLVATPCTAPFMGPALGFAFAAPTVVMVLVFSLLGLGLASPFLIIAFVPALYRFLPSPGPWMDTFKQAMGFTLVGTAIWLTSVLMDQIGSARTVGFLWFMATVALGTWVFGHFGGVAESGKRQLLALGAGLAVMAAGAWGFLDLQLDNTVCDDGSVVAAADLDFSQHIPWQPFSEARVAELSDQPVFIDFTATWCLSCKVNEKGVLETERVRNCMASQGVVPLRADWTRRDPVITSWLERHGSAGVPLYLVIPPGGPETLLPTVLTPGIVTGALGCS